MPGRERTFRLEAVVLRHADWGEADRTVTLYSREMGKVRGIAKGARKLRSRKAGHLEPFTRVQLQFAQARDMPIITQAETIDAYLPLRDDLVKTGYAAYAVELVDRFTYEEENAPGLYPLLVETLQRISTEADPGLAVRYYEVRLLDLLGFRPQLFACSHCGKPIQAQDQYFSALLGGVLCPDCGRGQAEVRPVSVDALRFLRHLQRSSYADALRARIPGPVMAEMESLLQYYLTYLLERSLNSPAFLRTVRRSLSDSREKPETNP